MKEKFIRTNNPETAKKLILLGFTEIKEPGSNSFCFLNNGKKLTFEDTKNDIVYTNMLHI